MIDNAYSELPGPEPRAFCHMSLRRRPDGTYAVEEVAGTVDDAGDRSGAIRVLLDSATLEAARAAYEALINERIAQGFEGRR